MSDRADNIEDSILTPQEAAQQEADRIWSLLTPEQQKQSTRTVQDQYGVNIKSNDTVDLDATLNDVRSLLSKANIDISRFSSDALTNFSRDLIALQQSHKTYMDKLAEQTVKAPDINWAERASVLSQKARADYATENAGKVGRMETIITSPLLDETDPVTTKNILGGS